ncbi:PD-(D/E)XK nuclease family protein [Phaeodactylibacter luteus]|uniref:PD-(D/E)XK nuclease family protein n=1 Tax=Phaeodactylibacter luteus TaxID=1564516 RepID=A0A5C6S3F0_9BACT|nr:PD-(D/E)XK nuclease family protein [Phaeodactylibacter luteus]TXB68340.1 hypothetical protein FRY97_02880 [Phaeodactylibacter luteus]
MDLNWLDNLFDDLPEVPKQRKNLIEISGFPRWENVISNFLSFYFDKEEEHGFSTLFLESLLNVYERKLEADVNTLREKLSRSVYIEDHGVIKGYSRTARLALFEGKLEKDHLAKAALHNLLQVYGYKRNLKGNFNILKEEIQSAEYTVEREQTTENGKRIDLLIQDAPLETEDENDPPTPPSWAIIIENKVYAPLYNDLQEYWNSVQADQKLGIVLSITGADLATKAPPDGYYVSILHKELVDEVVQNLHGSFLESDDRHLLFLKEYIANINSFYMSTDYTQSREELLEVFRAKQEAIRELKQKDYEVLDYVCRSVFNAMKEFGYPPRPWRAARKRNFFFDPSESSFEEKYNKLADKFRFWIDLDRIVFHSTCVVYFELDHPTNTVHGEAVKRTLRHKKLIGVNGSRVKEAFGGTLGKSYYHIYEIQLDLEKAEGATLQERFTNAMNRAFFKHESEYFEEALEALEWAMSSKG